MQCYAIYEMRFHVNLPFHFGYDCIGYLLDVLIANSIAGSESQA